MENLQTLVNKNYTIKDIDLREFVYSTTYQKLSSDGVKLYITLLGYANSKQDFVYPSHKDLAEKVNISEKKLKRVIHELEEMSLISYISGNGRLNSQYHFLDSWNDTKYVTTKQKIRKFTNKGEILERGKISKPSPLQNDQGSPPQNDPPLYNTNQVTNLEQQQPTNVVVDLEKVKWLNTKGISKQTASNLLYNNKISDLYFDALKLAFGEQMQFIRHPKGWLIKALEGNFDLTSQIDTLSKKKAKSRPNTKIIKSIEKEKHELQQNVLDKLITFKELNKSEYDRLEKIAREMLYKQGKTEKNCFFDDLLKFKILQLIQVQQVTNKN